MSRREGRDSDSKRHRSRFDREPSPKKSRRDGKPETERVPSNTNLDVGDHADRDQKHRRRLQDALPLEAPLAPDSKRENGAVSKESDKKPDEHREGSKHSSDPTEASRPRSFFQHDERGNAMQVGRSIGRRATSGWRDSKDQHDERAANKTTYNAQRRDEKLQAKQDDNSVWRHDRFLEKNDPPAGKKRPAFQEKKIPVNSEHADKAEIETVKSSHVDHSVEGSERREERSRNPRPLDRPEKPTAGDRLPPKRGEAHRDGFLSRERYGGGGGNYRGRDGMNGRQGYGAGGTRAEKWKHDMYNPEDGPPPKNEDDQIAKLEALLAS
ncbi:DNA polymerase kappa [Fagus crenata]